MKYNNYPSKYTYSVAENQPNVNPDKVFSFETVNERSRSEDPEEKRIIEASELFWGKLWTEIPTFHLESPEDLQEYKIDFCLSLIREKQEKAVNTALSLKEAKQNTVMLHWAQRKLAELMGGAQ
jgi:hypothetical protein